MSNSRMRAPALVGLATVRGARGAPGPTLIRARGTMNEPTSMPTSHPTLAEVSSDVGRIVAVGNSLLWWAWRSSPPLSSVQRQWAPLPGHGSLRGRREPPHDGVGSSGLVRSSTRSPAPDGVGPQQCPRDGRNPVPTGTPSAAASGSRAFAILAQAICASLADQRNSLPSRSILWRITASFRATATVAFLVPIRLASRVPQAFSADQRETRWRMIPAAS